MKHAILKIANDFARKKHFKFKLLLSYELICCLKSIRLLRFSNNYNKPMCKFIFIMTKKIQDIALSLFHKIACMYLSVSPGLSLH